MAFIERIEPDIGNKMAAASVAIFNNLNIFTLSLPLNSSGVRRSNDQGGKSLDPRP